MKWLVIQCYNTPIDDVPGSPHSAMLQEPAEMLGSPPALIADDKDEWYGLEYTLELSTRERRPSDTQSFSAGEHSKVRPHTYPGYRPDNTIT